MNPSTSASEATGPSPNGSAHSELKNLIADIEAVLVKAGHVSDVEVANLRETLREKLALASAGLLAGSRKVTAAARGAATSTDAYVHRSPWQSIGIAALAGTAVGFLLGRR